MCWSSKLKYYYFHMENSVSSGWYGPQNIVALSRWHEKILWAVYFCWRTIFIKVALPKGRLQFWRVWNIKHHIELSASLFSSRLWDGEEVPKSNRSSLIFTAGDFDFVQESLVRNLRSVGVTQFDPNLTSPPLPLKIQTILTEKSFIHVCKPYRYVWLWAEGKLYFNEKLHPVPNFLWEKINLPFFAIPYTCIFTSSLVRKGCWDLRKKKGGLGD